MILVVDLSYMGFIILKYIPATPTLLTVFVNGYRIVSKAFVFAFIEMIILFLFFILLMSITLTVLWILNYSCIPRINSIWSVWMIFLMYCWNWFANVLLRILQLCSLVILACYFLFLGCLCLVFVSGWCWPHRVSWKVFFPLQ